MESNRLVKGARVAGVLISIALLGVAGRSTRAQSQDSRKSPDTQSSQDSKNTLEARKAQEGRSSNDALTSNDAEKATPEVQQLKDRLQQLEQTVQQLKLQLAGMEKAQTAAATLSTHGDAATASTPIDVAPPAAGSAEPGSTGNTNQEKKGSESTFTVYGFAMLDAGYQFGQNDPNWFDVLRPSKLAAFEDQFAPSGKVFFGVRQSRLGVKSDLDTRLGNLKTVFEFELFGSGVDAGQTTFRLRHAYGELGHFGAGQTWSAFVDTDAFPNIIEYWGPNGLPWFRNVQFRWMPLKGDTAVTIAVERPGASGDQGVFADRIELQGIRPKFDMPDFTGNVRFNRDWGHAQISGVVRRIKWVDTTNPPKFDLSGSAVGWGVSTTSSINLNKGKNDIARLAAVYGEGVENYMNDAPVDVGIRIPRIVNPLRPFEGVALPVFGISAFLDHTWSKRFSTAIGYSMVNITNSNGQAADAYHRGQYALTNLLFYPIDNVMVGAEFQWGRRSNFGDGFSVNDYRTQFAFRYTFSKAFGLGL